MVFVQLVYGVIHKCLDYFMCCIVLCCILDLSFPQQSTEQQVQGILNLIDLAGSERLSKSGSTGDRLKETQVLHQNFPLLNRLCYMSIIMHFK